MNERHAASQFLRAVRGRRSQVAFSRRLGFRSNPAADWESGRRVPTAAQALEACVRSKIDVGAAFAKFHPASAPSLAGFKDEHVSAWLNALRGSMSIESLSSKIDRSRSSVSRWLSGRTRPQLTDFFLLVQTITGRVSDLVAELVDIKSVPSLLQGHVARQKAKRLAYEKPWTEPILRVVETAAYRTLSIHQPGWIAQRLGIDEAEEQACIQALLAAEVLVQRDGKYLSGSLSVDTVASPQEMNRLKSHWTHVALRRLESPREKDIFSYNVMSLSVTARDEVRRVLHSAYREIRAIAATPQDEEVVAHVNIQLISYD